MKEPHKWEGVSLLDICKQVRGLSSDKIVSSRRRPGSPWTVVTPLKAVYWKQYTLTIEVSPANTGNTAPLVLGVYVLNRGTRIDLSPVHHAGYQFGHWTYDGTDTGSINVPTPYIVMDSDHHVMANFEESPVTIVPTLPVATHRLSYYRDSELC
ncbi:MAG: hypothetical protein J7L91_00305 [Candidatus Korarchaeota archaeon]|nr:hypothetical protein [Candidatus Korarchaeota archaeon]